VLTAGDGAGVAKVFHLVEGKFMAHQRVYVLDGFRRLTPRFFFYAFSSMFYLMALDGSAKSTVDSVRRSMIADMPMPLPPSEEQEAITDYLDRETARIDELIAEQQRLIGIQRERRQSLMDRAVFGLDDIDQSVRGLRLIGRHRAVEPLLERTPAHWRIERFKSVFVRLDQRNSDLAAPMMSLKSTGEIVPRSSMGERQEPDENSLPRYLVARVDDLVVNPMWLIGGAIGITRVDGAVSPDYRVFRSTGQHHPRYLHYLLRSRPYLDQYVLYTRAQTTFDRRVQQADLDNLPLPIPPLAEQVGIAARIDSRLARIDEMIGETEVLINLAQERRSALIAAAVTGQIDVKESAA
jgi:type I restriction enzyme S subunit